MPFAPMAFAPDPEMDINPTTGRPAGRPYEYHNGPKQKSIGSLIAGFKSAVTKQINILRNMPQVPVWQRNYYEHIIRDDHELNRIRDYVIYNPNNWESDNHNPNKNPNNDDPW